MLLLESWINYLTIDEISFPLPLAKVNIVSQKGLQSLGCRVALKASDRGFGPAIHQINHDRLVALQVRLHVQIVYLQVIE